MSFISFKDVSKIYQMGEVQIKALDDISFDIEKGEFVAIVGTSGSGKSTLLHMLGGLDHPTSGSVTVDGKELGAMGDEELTIFRRRKIGFVFQSFNLVPVGTSSWDRWAEGSNLEGDSTTTLSLQGFSST